MCRKSVRTHYFGALTAAAAAALNAFSHYGICNSPLRSYRFISSNGAKAVAKPSFQNILQNFRIMLKKGSTLFIEAAAALSSLKGVATFTLIGANSMQTQRK